MGKVMILSFSEDEEDVCQRMLQIISESPRFEGCNVLPDNENAWRKRPVKSNVYG